MSMYQILKFRRQFLLTMSPISELNYWNKIKIGQYYLYSHSDLELHQVSDLEKSIVLLGDLYDAYAPEKDNQNIIQDILRGADSVGGFISKLRKYAGCYVALFKMGDDTVLINDARGSREIYYCTENNRIVCGSQPNLIAKFSSPEIKPTKDKTLLDFYGNHLRDSRWIGDETYFNGIKHLLPNRYLDINKRRVCRYWPSGPIRQLTLDEAVSKSCVFLQGIMKAIVQRHSAMMAVTGGIDSRTLLAASRGIQDKIYYFINNIGLGYNHPDISVPKKIFESIRVPFNIQEVSHHVDDEFRKIFLGNTFLASDHYLPPIYHIFYQNHSQKRCILGIGEIGRSFYGKKIKNLNGYRLAYLQKYEECRYVIEQCEEILVDILPVANKSGINVLDLFYWEQRLGNWAAVRNSESYIAIEKVDPYNSHLLMEVFLGVEKKYSKKRKNILFREMIRHMWPELLAWPINPPCTMRDKVTGFLDNIGVYEFLRELKYQLGYLRYLCKDQNR